jgi:hypothetical protein
MVAFSRFNLLLTCAIVIFGTFHKKLFTLRPIWRNFLLKLPKSVGVPMLCRGSVCRFHAPSCHSPEKQGPNLEI